MKSASMVALLLAMTAAGWPQSPPKPRVVAKKARRLALVVGNQKYRKLTPPLPGSKTALDLVQPALENAGFVVTVVADAGYAELKIAIDKFVGSVHEGDICLFYYSGYAVQNDDDDYLLPADFDPATEKVNNKLMYPVSAMAKNLELQKARIKLFFLEGGRNFNSDLSDAAPGVRIPYTGDVREWLLAIPNLGTPTVNTPPDQPGLLTQALVEAMDTEKPLAECMSQVLKQVREQSKDRQQPAWNPGVDEVFYFHKPHVRSQNGTDREWYVWIPRGKFLMGCVPGAKCEKDEEPQHEVTLTKGFWMGENEVQVRSYKNFTIWNKDKKNDGDKKFGEMPKATEENKGWHDEDHPMAYMTFEQADKYCAWAGGRLPTEAEWERAARGDKEKRIYPFDSLEESQRKAMFFGNHYYKYTAPVQKFDHNEYGLFDMAGNVWEVVSDYFARYTADPVKDPKGPPSGKHHVMRGGSYDSDPKTHLRISYREPFDKPWPNRGFRCVMDDSAETSEILQIP